MRTRRTAAVAVGLALATSALFPGTAAADSSTVGPRSWTSSAADLTDLQLASDSPFDGASAAALMVTTRKGGSRFYLAVSGVDRSAAGSTYGAHLHSGPCVEGDGAAAGPHYNTDLIAGDDTPRVNRRTEVWLDFSVSERGTGWSKAGVPFVPQDGVRSVLIHEEPTDDAGAAGGRLACIPFVLS